jgi:penicillin-binding protein 1C
LRADAPAAGARTVFDPATAFLVGDILADRESRSTTFGLESPLATRFWTAVKTGTSTDMRDNWCVGFSRRYTVGVWVGNFSGAPMHDVSGVTGAAPAWLEVMERLHRDVPSEPPLPPPGVVATPAVFPAGVEPPRHEWTRAGSETPGGRGTLAATARVRTPVFGARIALDPDIPSERQRVLLEATSPDAAARWRLDGTDIGPARPTLHEPHPGQHVLELVGGAGTVVDRVVFEVRGRCTGSGCSARSSDRRGTHDDVQP